VCQGPPATRHDKAPKPMPSDRAPRPHRPHQRSFPYPSVPLCRPHHSRPSTDVVSASLSSSSDGPRQHSLRGPVVNVRFAARDVQDNDLTSTYDVPPQCLTTANVAIPQPTFCPPSVCYNQAWSGSDNEDYSVAPVRHPYYFILQCSQAE
jgi:hypothetical protein